MENVSFGEMLFRLIISLLLGGLIGLEREAHERPAGLRTHILVCVGSTFFTLASFAISKSYAGYVFDPGRITAQIVTGIGFLGAGTIIRTGTIVRGLTTAASIWTVAAIGVGVGVGGKMLWLSIAASVLVFGTLTTVRSLEQFLSMKRNERTLIATVRSDKNALCNLLNIITKNDARAHSISTEDTSEGTYHIRMRLKVGRNFDENNLDADMTMSEDVISYSWE